jgi:hypothetical protein
MKNDVLQEIHSLLGAKFSHGLCLDPLSEFIEHDEQVGYVPVCLLEGSQDVQTPYGESQGNGDCLELLGRGVNLPSKILTSPVGPYYLCHIAGRSQPVKTLSDSLLDHAC